MADYPFQLVRYGHDGGEELRAHLARRPFTKRERTFEADAHRFVPGEQLETAINTAIAVGEPLLITGEPGTGKTQAAYYTAYKLGLAKVFHFQVKSDSTARDLLYQFDTVQYFHAAHLAGTAGAAPVLDKAAYVRKRDLWEAFDAAREQGVPQVVLIDEIDKAPRDFPNDLLHEIDKMDFTVIETGERVEAERHLRPIVFITSNSERRLPEPFLRRCVYHHIRFDERLLRQIVASRADELEGLSDEFVQLAIERFLDLRSRYLRKLPANGEFLVWLEVLALATGATGMPREQLRARLEGDLGNLPYLGVLLKHHQDIEELQGARQ
jgi:MoxR-like ATPase